MILALLLLVIAPAGEGAAAEAWPTARAGAILATPNWSDYRIYPKDALEKEEQGRVLPEIWIGRDGRPKACRILSSSSFPELDAGTCKLMMQMRFEPALNPLGEPIESHYSRVASWRLTDEMPFGSAAMRTRITLEIGQTRICDIEQAEGPYTELWSSAACSIFGDRTYYFGGRAKESLTAMIEVRLDAGDRAPLVQQPWPTGTVIASEKVAFVINSAGDASECASIESHGFGPRGLNNLSPCGRLLSMIWFAEPAEPGTVRKGVFETRVIAVDQR